MMQLFQEVFWRIPWTLSALDLRNIVAGLALDENNVPLAADRIKVKVTEGKKKREKRRKKTKEVKPKKKNANKFAALKDLVKRKAEAKKTKR